ncbi:hypothetical protein BGZ98_001063 [Dissophora globulifera]|nr:hypothetical protein BGZ98_001063 [Dissophora globulifera]
MKINVRTTILSLAAVSTVIAAPVHLDKRNFIADKLLSLFIKAFHTMECDACVVAIAGLKDVARLSQKSVLDVGKALCPTVAKWPADVCDGLVDLYGPPLMNAILKADIKGGDGKLGVCPAPAVTSGTLTFPKPRPANISVPSPSGKLVDVLHLSDWHVDEHYTAGTEANCGSLGCCQVKTPAPTAPLNRSAASWGDYNCDTPVKLTQDLLKFIPKVATPEFAIFTGDIPPHDIWMETQSTVRPVETHAYQTMAEGLQVPKVYPTVGNHESAPASLYPTPSSNVDNTWLYTGLADDWSRWLPAEAVNTVKNYGAYTVSPTPGFRIISLNTNFCYTANVHLYANTKDYDPFGELNWLIKQLQAAEDAGERVWVMGHLSPGMTDCLENWSALYYQVIQRYSPHVVAEQFFGHTHRDEFGLYYGPGGDKNSQNAIATAWIGPSVTPYTNLNPGFRVYKVDTQSWNIFDAETYIANLDQAPEWDTLGSTPNWHLEYSARQAYGAFVPVADNAPLSASWWHEVTTVLETNNDAFQQFWTYRGKSAKLQGDCAVGSDCATNIICNLRAGKSSDACASSVRALKKRSDNVEAKLHALADGVKTPSGLQSPFRQASVPLWEQKLCGPF